MTTQHENNGWKRVVMQQTIQAGREGWPGVWDALVAAITRKPRLVIPRPITLSLWVKTDGSVGVEATQQMYVGNTQVEIMK